MNHDQWPKCPACGRDMFLSQAHGSACEDPACVNAHGIVKSGSLWVPTWSKGNGVLYLHEDDHRVLDAEKPRFLTGSGHGDIAGGDGGLFCWRFHTYADPVTHHVSADVFRQPKRQIGFNRSDG